MVETGRSFSKNCFGQMYTRQINGRKEVVI